MDINMSDKERIEGQLKMLEVAGRRIEELEGLVSSLESDYQNAMKPMRGISDAPQSEWVNVDDSPVNGSYDWKVGDKAIGYNGYAFEIEWDGDCWCSIGGEDFTHWMSFTPPKQ